MRYRERTLLDNIAVLGNFNGLSIGGKKYTYWSSYHVTGHILSAYLTSPYSKREEDSYVLTWDGGIYPSLYLVRAQERKIDCIGPLFRLFGSSYEMFARSFPPFQQEDERTLSIAGKVMAYIALGKVQPILLKALKIAGKDLNTYQHDFPLKLAEYLKHRVDCCSLSTADFLCTFHSYLQGLLCATLEQFSKKFDRKPNLCISGGCALNIKWNSAIRELGLFNDVYIPPFPNDSGSAIGAACADLFTRGEAPTLEWSVYLGPRLHTGPPASGWEQREFSLNQLAALLHETQEPVVFLSGRAELGPRALGNRSILASASSPGMKNLLNFIKDREPYRPVAPICLEVWASRIFDPGFRDPFMLFEHRIRNEWRDRIPAVLHLDQTARLQTVSPQDNPVIAELLAAYLSISGVPVLCNTSANYPGAGFFPSARAATEWDRVNYIWSDNLLYERVSKRPLST